MIRVNDMDVMICGSTQEILYEFITIIIGLRQTLAEKYGEEMADSVITDLSKIAYIDASSKTEFLKAVDEIVGNSPFLELQKDKG